MRPLVFQNVVTRGSAAAFALVASAAMALAPVASRAADPAPQASPQFTSQHSFSSDTGRKSGGASPRGGLLQAADGTLYGLASEGGAKGLGTLYRMSVSGQMRTLVSFTDATGSYPQGELVQDDEGNLYGAAGNGGACPGCGSIFKLTAAGDFSVLHQFSPDEGGYSPNGSLLLAPDGNFYGTTFFGGDFGAGTIFRMTPAGITTLVHSFGGSFDSALYPMGGLMRARDGNLYGTTSAGGSTNSGTIYRLAADGSFTTLASFTFFLGRSPHGTLVQGRDGALYGTTANDGPENSGTAFRYTTDGGLKRIATFGGEAGTRPFAGLVMGPDGNFYGTTQQGGSGRAGTVFAMTRTGKLRAVHAFRGPDGSGPEAPLTRGSDGAVYGTTTAGGDNGVGTVFKISR